MSEHKYVIFSDLDGTLLDHETYDYLPALPALRKIRSQKVPLIFSSSKTRAEIQSLRLKLGNRDPYIVENGGAIYVPENYFRSDVEFDEKRNGERVIKLGASNAEMRKALKALRARTRLAIVGFGDLTAEQVGQLTDLSITDARLALNRQHGEPFYFAEAIEPAKLLEVSRMVHELGLKLTRGGRFHYLYAQSDKGNAVRKVAEMFNRDLGFPPKTIGIGDSLNDLAMLLAVDLPILVKRPEGQYDRDVLTKIKPILAGGIGPRGWNDALLKLLE